jgi:hypothetical protein
MGERLDLSKPRYDQSTYIGRVKHYFEVTDPRTILASDKRERPPQIFIAAGLVAHATLAAVTSLPLTVSPACAL